MNASGWDFSFMDGRWRESPLTWDYRTMILERSRRAAAMLDMGTGARVYSLGRPLRLAASAGMT